MSVVHASNSCTCDDNITPKKTKLVLLPGRILTCKQKHTTNFHVSDGGIKAYMKAVAANRMVSLSQDMGGFACSTDCLPNAGPTPSTWLIKIFFKI